MLQIVQNGTGPQFFDKHFLDHINFKILEIDGKVPEKVDAVAIFMIYSSHYDYQSFEVKVLSNGHFDINFERIENILLSTREVVRLSMAFSFKDQTVENCSIELVEPTVGLTYPDANNYRHFTKDLIVRSYFLSKNYQNYLKFFYNKLQ